jgi:hypothetical protein
LREREAMSYSGYEVSDGEVLARVQAFCRHLTDGGVFTDSSSVLLADVERYVSDAYLWLVGELAQNGWDTVVTDDRAKGILCQIQALDAAVQIEMSQPSADDGEKNNRFNGMVARRDRLVRNFLQSRAFEDQGGVRKIYPSSYLTGTGQSRDDKEQRYADSSKVQNRFRRGQGQRVDTSSRLDAEPPRGS